MKNKKGFTLLELLVVVLIIGILAGIALPQYQKVKEKAEASQLLISLKALQEAQQRYFLEKGVFATNFDNLDIEFSGYERGGCEDFSYFFPTDCISKDNSALLIHPTHSLYALRKTGKYKKSGYVFYYRDSEQTSENTLWCYENHKNGYCSELLKCNFGFNWDVINDYYSCKF